MHIPIQPMRSYVTAIIIALVVSLHCIPVNAEQPDTSGISRPDLPLPSYMIPHPEDSVANETLRSGLSLPIPASETYLPTINHQLSRDRFTIPPLNLKIDMPTSLFGWSGGSIAASGSRTSMPGLMGIESGRISANQSFGNLTLTAWVGADKYGWFRELETSYGVGGSATYTFSPRWSATIFGEFYTPTRQPLTPAIAEIMNTSRFGGYASYNFNDHWGISIGAQAIRSCVNNHWEARPIVTPYYRINKSVSIGIDVGGILYNVAKDYIDSKNRNSYPPSGAPVGGGRPPIPTPARVAPRR